MYNFIKAACVVPDLRVADTEFNTEEILKRLKEADKEKPDFVIFPELSITGSTCRDLFFQEELIRAGLDGLRKITEESRHYNSVIITGLPVCAFGQLYNCAAVIFKGKVFGLVPKSFVPDYSELNEKRWFSSAFELTEKAICSKQLGFEEEYDIPIGSGLIFDISGEVKFALELSEDLSAVIPPSSILAMGGAELIINPAAQTETVLKRSRIKKLIEAASSSSLASYIYTSAGAAESTQDAVFSGYSVICEKGSVLKESSSLCDSGYILYADTDLGRIKADRKKIKSFKDSATSYKAYEKTRTVLLPRKEFLSDGSLYPLEKSPFIPVSKEERLKRCSEIFKIQVAGLKKRLSVTNSKAVIGVSGGLDSTLALLVAVETMKELGRPLTDVWGITMPCFGTSSRTYNNSLKLMETLGISFKEINIKEACLVHFKDIDHDPEKLDLTYENTQARERTQVLMDFAGKVGGMVIGTGDLSELALGWCTYNGDHMSMYGVNAGIPKTMIKWIIDSIAEDNIFPESSEYLRDITDTPISPELLPPDKEGKISQKTEDLVGPYPLHDFFLYYILRYGFAPEKIYHMAKLAFKDEYDSKTVLKWLKNFYRRFFTQQFKRSCMPDGMKIGSVGLSPRGEWQMPSDASGKIWLDSAEKIRI